jgi:hypothetical protein
MKSPTESAVKKSLSISESEFQLIEEKLSNLVVSTNSRCALLIDKSGYLILAKGHFHFVPPDDMGVLATGAFSALCSMVDVAAAHLTITYHFPGAESLHFCVINPNIFLVIVYKAIAQETLKKSEEIMKMCRLFAKEIKGLIGKRGVKDKGPASFDFITKKIDEIFKKEV